MELYTHKVQYYETDRMGITHHSNYIRWMEEARTDFLAKIGLGYDKIEEMGIVSPVTAVECSYKNTTTLGCSAQENIASKKAFVWQSLLQIALTTTKGAFGNFHSLCTKTAVLQVRAFVTHNF